MHTRRFDSWWFTSSEQWAFCEITALSICHNAIGRGLA